MRSGLQILSFTVKDVMDEVDYLNSLGKVLSFALFFVCTISSLFMSRLKQQTLSEMLTSARQLLFVTLALRSDDYILSYLACC